MPIPVALNVYLRNQVRKPFVLPRPADLPILLPFEGDTSAESLAKLRAAGATPTLADLQNAAREAAEAAARAQAAPPRTSEYTISEHSVPDSSSILSFGIISEPSILSYITVVLAAQGGTGDTEAMYGIRLLPGALQQPGNMGEAPYNSASPIWQPSFGNPPDSRRNQRIVRLRAGAIITEAWVIAFPVTSIPSTLIARVETTETTAVGPTIDFQIGVISAAVIPTGSNFQFLPAQNRISINLNTQQTPSRSPTPLFPRAAKVSVIQGGQILTQRIIPWGDLAPQLRQDWFDRQLGKPPDRAIEWIP